VPRTEPVQSLHFGLGRIRLQMRTFTILRYSGMTPAAHNHSPANSIDATVMGTPALA
jgi:hypothetical protein